MAFEYDRFQRFRPMKHEFVYFFDSSIVLEPIVSYCKNSGICGSSIGPTLLVLCCVKAISIHIISSKWPDPIGTTIGNLPQLGTHRRIRLGLQVRHIVWTFEQLIMPYYERSKLIITFSLNQDMKWGLPFPAPCLSRALVSLRVGALDGCLNCIRNSLFEIWRIRIEAALNECWELNDYWELTVCTAALRKGWSTHIAWQRATLVHLRSWRMKHLHFLVALGKGWGSS